jgi:hypothetical protein
MRQYDREKRSVSGNWKTVDAFSICRERYSSINWSRTFTKCRAPSGNGCDGRKTPVLFVNAKSRLEERGTGSVIRRICAPM